MIERIDEQTKTLQKTYREELANAEVDEMKLWSLHYISEQHGLNAKWQLVLKIKYGLMNLVTA